MTQLKTLKDFDDFVDNNNSTFIERCSNSDMDNIKEEVKDFFRQEVIKWVDALKEKGNKKDIFSSEKTTWGRGKLKMSADIFIKHFFNITKEDLK